MEVLSEYLATQAADLRLAHEVVAIDPKRQRMLVRHEGREVEHTYHSCLSTIPLPRASRCAKEFPKICSTT